MPDEGRERVMESLDFRGVPNPVANPAKQGDEVAILSQVTGAIAAHKTETNPHSQYAASATLGTAATKAATDFDAAGTASRAIAAHEATTNHPLATSTTAGLMSSADKNKLNNLSPSPTDVLSRSGNLGDVPDKAVARNNLGLGSAAQANSSSFEPAGAVSTHAAQTGNGFHLPSGGITNAEMAANAAIADSKLAFTIPPWIAVTYAANWSTFSGAEAVSYRKYASKMVQLSGVASKIIGLINNDLICTLPVGFRPDRLARFIIYGSSAAGTLTTAFLTISTAGEVRLLLGSTNPSQYVAIPNNCMFFAQ